MLFYRSNWVSLQQAPATLCLEVNRKTVSYIQPSFDGVSLSIGSAFSRDKCSVKLSIMVPFLYQSCFRPKICVAGRYCRCRMYRMSIRDQSWSSHNTCDGWYLVEKMLFCECTIPIFTSMCIVIHFYHSFNFFAVVSLVRVITRSMLI